MQLSPFRSFDFDSAVIVLLSDADYSVWKAAKIPAEAVRAARVYNSHVNGRIVFARPDLMDHAEAVDADRSSAAVSGSRVPERAFGARVKHTGAEIVVDTWDLQHRA